MANSVGMLKESIWRDHDWRALPRTAQATYAQLLSQKELDRAGMLPLQVSKWTKGCDEITEAVLWDDLKLLQARRFVFIDEDTDELFVRSYMRHSEVTKYPQFLKSAIRCSGMVASPYLRHELADELRKLHRAEATKLADEIDPGETVPEPFENPSGTVPEPSANPSGTVNPSGTLREPSGEGEGVGEGTLVSGQVGREDDEPPTHCQRHRNTENPPGCHNCRKSREAHEAWEGRQELARRRAKSAAAERQRDCDQCDEGGWALGDDGLPVEPAIKCTVHA